MAVVSRPWATQIAATLLSVAIAGSVAPVLAQSKEPAPAAIAVAALPSTGSTLATITSPDAQDVTRSAAQTLSTPKLPTQVTAKDAWTIVLVQTALAEKGCRDVAINGTWDQPTEVATLTALALPQRPERLVVNDEMVRLVRSAPSSICPPWNWGSAPRIAPQARDRRIMRAPNTASPVAVARQAAPVRQAKLAPAVQRVAAVRVARTSVSVARMTVNVPVF